TLLAELADDSGQIVRHQSEIALTQRNPVYAAGHQVQQALEVLNAAHDTPQAANRRERRIVRVHGELYVGFFGNRDYTFQEVFQVLPEFVLGHDTVFGQRRILHQRIIVAGDQSAAACGRGG